jgi:membrane dipeptidase
MAEGLGDVTRFPALLAELLARGYTDEEVKKIAGGNLLRVMREAEQISEELRKERDPSIADSRQIHAR